MWYKLYDHDQTSEVLQCSFGVRSLNNRNDTYYPYSTGCRVMKTEVHREHWILKWFFLEGL